jgi:enolase-phosphatase E1
MSAVIPRGQVRAVVTDIEGTTTRIAFVTEVLFPYARERIAHFLAAHQQQPAVSEQIAVVRALMQQPDASIESVTQQLIEWLDADQKITPLKTLQGMIWVAGYQDGSLRGHLYPDVAPMLRQWQQQGISLSIYSSGSVAAQKLLFGYSVDGDLTPLFSHYFDTNIGHKRAAQSYVSISQALGLPAEQILFLSDITAELDAAAQAGLLTLGLDRLCICDGFGAHPFVHHFDQIEL